MRSLLLIISIFLLSSVGYSQSTDQLTEQLERSSNKNEKVEILKKLATASRESNTNALKLYAEELITIAKEDSTINSYAWGKYFLGDFYYLTDQNKKSIGNFESALVLFKNQYDFEGIGESASSLSNVYFYFDKYNSSLNYAQTALKAYKKTGNLLKQAKVLTLICDVYTYLGKYNEAINYCIESMNIMDNIKVDINKEVTLNTVGQIYMELGSLYKAKDYFYHALEYALKNGEPYNIATSYSNLGNLFIKLNKYDSALSYFNKAMVTDSINKDIVGLAYSNYDIGTLYMKKGDFVLSKNYLLSAQKYAAKAEMPELIAKTGITLGELYASIKEYDSAIETLEKSLKVALEINSSTMLKEAYQTISKTYEMAGNKDSALVYMKLSVKQAEKKFIQENAEAIAEIETKYSLEQKEKEIAILQKEKAISKLEAKQKQFLITGAAVAVVFLLILIFILYNRNSLKNKINKKLQNQNEEIRAQNEEIEAQKEEIELRGNRLEENNEQIVDSIRYAKQIQESLLPRKQLVKQFFPKSFIYYKPKDIVSGDFYWQAQVDDKIALAVIDCTGHGVPGAFMTILANSLLNQIILESEIYSPDLVISLLDQKIQQTLHQNNLGNTNTDGLDIGLIFFDKTRQEVQYAGAKIPLYLVQNGEMDIYQPDRKSVGSTQLGEKVYNKKLITVNSGDMLYMSTDGYQDQFGGKEEKKFMKKNFYNFLSSLSNLPTEEQERSLEMRFKEWKGNNPQTDDILVIGIKI